MQINFGVSHPLFQQCFAPVADYTAVLTPEEYKVVRGAVRPRVLAFSSGRHCAKKALASFGLRTPEILRGSHKEPRWPRGFVGSISHSPMLAGAVVAPCHDVAAMGLDIEELGRVQPGMWNMVFTPSEQDFLRSHTAEEQRVLTTLFFSLKESFYKLQFSLTHFPLWFTDVAIHATARGFKLQLLREVPGPVRLPTWTDMYFAQVDKQVISLCLLAR